jgi:hypothetical protein
VKRLFARTQIGAVRAYRRTRNAHAKSRITRVIAVAGRAELPEDLHPRRLYLLGATTPKWALLDCPCGRGHTIELNLVNPERTRWTVTTNETGRPSVHPSIDYQGQPRCHYWLKDGRIQWVPNRTRS